MRQRSGMAAAALAFLLALSCTPALAGNISGPSGTATPTTLDKQQGGGGLENPDRDDSPQAVSPSSPPPSTSSPLPTPSPLSHTTPMPSSPTLDAADDAAAVQAQSSAAWTVSFDTAGGGSVDRQTVPDGGQASRPSPDPARDGYLFDGWFQGDVAYDFTQPVTGSTTLTAHWTKGDGYWAISPSQGPIAGGAKVTSPRPRDAASDSASSAWEAFIPLP
ncbi:InlB B-repeat-containing protein [Bifidobacterium sp. ESL0822]|uniref:InlB B-repeat-containing protein n=1 Tax=Bifidobacterium sp. ESL0822 TaxID=3448585 RepID=UPI004041E49B